jgi:hypothetical protein
MTYTHDRIKRSDLDPALLIWGLRKRVDLSTLPDRRVVLRFEFSGVAASRTKFRIMWLVLGRSCVDVCMKDPGFAVDLTLRGNIRDYVEVYLGHTKWRNVAGTALQFDGDPQIARAFPVWLRFETVNRLNGSAPHLSAGRAPVQTDHSDRLPSRPRGMRARSPGGRARQIGRARATRLHGSAVLWLGACLLRDIGGVMNQRQQQPVRIVRVSMLDLRCVALYCILRSRPADGCYRCSSMSVCRNRFGTHFSQGLSGAVYGLMLIVLMLVMPGGFAGAVRIVLSFLKKPSV